MCQSSFLKFPNIVECNVCGWTGRRFLSDGWHLGTNCPFCRSSVRHRLFIATLDHIADLSFEKTIFGKEILHFAAEEAISAHVKPKAMHYVTADYLRGGFDLRLDITKMPEIPDGEFDVVMAFDVLEHVSNYRRALNEIYRALKPRGLAILMVPQKDHLITTYEDPSIVSEEERIRHFGQRDHLRIFGDDFPEAVHEHGFTVRIIDETCFSVELRDRHVLCPAEPSPHPLATNHRKVFFCERAE